ncbi:metallophosphoesterase [Lutibacter sp. B2]|nr:metallophosphoesterase [Lutibacter sp. B2]
MINFKKFFHTLVGTVYIPEEILASNEKILVHISDTPVNFFSALNTLLKKITPAYIIHTGDMVDNIKLEMYPYRVDEYSKHVHTLIKILENSSARKIYLALGNHDSKTIVESYINKSILVEGIQHIQIEGIPINISHYSSEIVKSPAKYNFFGHDLSLKSKISHEQIYLNGLLGIHIILLDSNKIFTLPYPYGTDDSRMCKSKIGF